MASETSSILHTRDGLALTAHHHLPSEARARIVLVHGYAEHTGRYRELIAQLTAAGYECHAMDLRGHGASEGVRGHVSRFEEYLDDLDLFLEHLDRTRTAAPAVPAPLPCFLVGHSLGGLISLQYVLNRPSTFLALAVSSPFLHPALPIPWLKEALGTVASHLAPTLLLDSGIDPRGLSHDRAVVDAYASDPLVFRTVSPRWFTAAREAQDDTLKRAGEIHLPTLFLLGSADPIAQPERGREVFERLGSPRKRLKVYEGFFHEVLNEVDRQWVIGDLMSWLDEQVSVPEPGR